MDDATVLLVRGVGGTLGGRGGGGGGGPASIPPGPEGAFSEVAFHEVAHGHAADVNSVAWAPVVVPGTLRPSPTAGWYATAAEESAAAVWDGATRRLVRNKGT